MHDPSPRDDSHDSLNGPHGPESELELRLEQLAPVGVSEARERAKLAARLRHADPRGTTTARGSARKGHSRGRFSRLLPSPLTATLTGSALLTILLLATLTTPGQAVAEWVGERFGIGQPGGPPTLRSMHEFADQGNQVTDNRHLVVAAGESEIGGPFEVVTDARVIDGNRCFGFDRLEGHSISGGACEPLPPRRGMTLEFLGSQLGLGAAGMALGEGIQTLGGRVSTDVERVEVSLAGKPLDTALIEPEPEVLERAGLDQRFKVYVAFSDDFFRGGQAEAKGYDADGNLIVTRRHQLFDRVAMHRATCEGARKRLRQGRLDRGGRVFLKSECRMAAALEAAADR